MREKSISGAQRTHICWVAVSCWLAVVAARSSVAADVGTDGAETLKRVRVCTVEPDSTKRLACYDHELGRSTAPTADFGMNAEVVKRAQADAGVKAPSAPSQIPGKVAAVRFDPYNKVIVTLESGQIWQQQDFNLDFPVQVGDEIHFKTGALGALWMLDAHNRIQTRVTRVK